MTSTAHAAAKPHLVLIPGYWLGAWAWNDVIEKLTSAGVLATALTLPGLDPNDPERTARTLDDQAEAVINVLNELSGNAVLVAHSGANGPVSLAMDRHPELIRSVIWVDSGPMANGTAYAPDLPTVVSELPLPDFESLGQEASLEGLTDRQLARFRSKAVPQPAGIARGTVELTNPARHDVATTLICCSLPSAQILELVEQGHPMFSAVAQLTRMNMVDLPTGHWPMWSRPQALADAILTAASSSQ